MDMMIKIRCCPPIDGNRAQPLLPLDPYVYISIYIGGKVMGMTLDDLRPTLHNDSANIPLDHARDKQVRLANSASTISTYDTLYNVSADFLPVQTSSCIVRSKDIRTFSCRCRVISSCYKSDQRNANLTQD